jgi:hypothetical protein
VLEKKQTVAMTEHSETAPPLFLRWSWLYAPALAAIYPVLHTYADSMPESDPRDAVICGVVLLIAAITLACLLQLVFSGAKRASFAAVVIIGWCFTFVGYLRVGRIAIETLSKSALNDYLLMLFWLMLLLLALLLLSRVGWSEYRIGRAYRFLKLGCLFAVIFALIEVVNGHWRGTPLREVSGSMWESDREAIPSAWKPGPMAQHRDIYYLLYDRYASEEVLRRFFDFDNSEFDNELEKRGFVVDRNAVTSYPMTSTSMASTLNMRYLGPQVESNSDYFATVQSNAVGKLLIQAGYKYYFFGNQYEGLRNSSIAQWNLKISVMPSEFADSLVSMTPFRPLIGRRRKHEFTIEKSAAVAAVAKDPALTFAYSHFLVPHPPYAFARDGSAQTETNRATQPEKKLYIDQLVATNRLILKTIDEILSSSAVKPIIILQADEGPYLMVGDENLSRDEQMTKRRGILNAFLIPDETIWQRLPKRLMPVNTFRFLFKEYFGAPIELLPDRAFYWETPEPTGAADAGSRIIEVTQDVFDIK